MFGKGEQMRHLVIAVIAIFGLSACSVPQAPVNGNKHKASTLSDNKVDLFTLFRVEVHNGNTVIMRDNDNSRMTK
jgi:hypothetical protein